MGTVPAYTAAAVAEVDMSVRAIAATVLILAVLTFAAVAVVVGSGLYDFAADSPRAALVTKQIGFARERSIEVRAASVKALPLSNPKMIREGAEHYAEMCVACHLAPGMPDNEMRPGMNPKPPALAAIPSESPAEQFWIIKHGLKMTAMPAWGTTHSDEEIWNMVAFLQKLPSMSPQQYRGLTQEAHTHHGHM
jgi:mono/diheme cytochrome c family protein